MTNNEYVYLLFVTLSCIVWASAFIAYNETEGKIRPFIIAEIIMIVFSYINNNYYYAIAIFVVIIAAILGFICAHIIMFTVYQSSRLLVVLMKGGL